MQEDYNVRKDCNKSSQANPTEVYFWCAIWLIYLLACHFTKHENTLNICSVYLFHTVTIVSIYLEYPLILLLKYVRFAYTHTHIYIYTYIYHVTCFLFFIWTIIQKLPMVLFQYTFTIPFYGPWKALNMPLNNHLP